jgi:hypothetical protein
MRILLSEKQFNLIILNEAPDKIGNVHKIPYKQYTREQIKDELKWFKENGVSRSDAYGNKNKSFKNRVIELGLIHLVNEYLPDTRGNKPKTPDESNSDFYNILNYYKETGENIHEYKNDEDKKKKQQQVNFLNTYKYDFSGKIPNDGKKHKSLMDLFYELGGKKGKTEKMVYYTEDSLKEIYNGLVKNFNNLYNKILNSEVNVKEDLDEFYNLATKFLNRKDYRVLTDYKDDFSERIREKKDENTRSLFDRFKEEVKYREKFEKVIEKEYNILVKKYKDSDIPLTSKDRKRLKYIGKFEDFIKVVGRFREYLGEYYIAKYLESKNLKEDVDFFRTKTCKLPGKKCLYADFHLPKYNTIIEFDGAQHFRHVNFSGKYTYEAMEKKLKNNQNNDKLKNEYCKNEGIKLYRIKHNSKESVTEEEMNKIMGRIFNDIESGRFAYTFDKVGYIETADSKKYESKMNTNPMANLDEAIYRILNDFKKQYIY